MNETINKIMPSDMEVIIGLEEIKMIVQETIHHFIKPESKEVNIFKPNIKITKEEIIAKFYVCRIDKKIILNIIYLLGDREYSLNIVGKKLLLRVER